MTDTVWVSHLAEQLICEVAEQMGDIRLTCAEFLPKTGTVDREMDAVCAVFGGDYSISIRLDADHALFVRFARNMLGREPEEDEVPVYAKELLNVICGRFISELIHKADVSIKLMPIHYELFAESAVPDNAAEDMHELDFVSNAQEYAVFSWTSLPIEELLRRNML